MKVEINNNSIKLASKLCKVGEKRLLKANKKGKENKELIYYIAQQMIKVGECLKHIIEIEELIL